jgi:hypothetical protein
LPYIRGAGQGAGVARYLRTARGTGVCVARRSAALGRGAARSPGDAALTASCWGGRGREMGCAGPWGVAPGVSPLARPFWASGSGGGGGGGAVWARSARLESLAWRLRLPWARVWWRGRGCMYSWFSASWWRWTGREAHLEGVARAGAAGRDSPFGENGAVPLSAFLCEGDLEGG